MSHEYTQRYSSPLAHQRMSDGTCPECGHRAEAHSDDPRFWIPRGVTGCSLLTHGVTDRIAAYLADLDAYEQQTAGKEVAQ